MTLQQDEQAVSAKLNKLQAFWQKYGTYVLYALVFGLGMIAGHKL